MAGGVNAIGNLPGKVNANNALVVTLDGGVASATTFLAGDGTEAAPSYSFASNPTTGIYLHAPNNFAFSSGGAVFSVLRNDAISLLSTTILGWSTAPTAVAIDAALKRAGVGHVLSSLGRLLDVRVNAAITADSNQTYTAANVLGGIVTRSGITANRVDAMPTAANLVAALPGAVVGTSFDFVINNNDDASTITFNGASTGITYEGAATALAAGDAWLFRVLITNITGAAEAATVYQVAK